MILGALIDAGCSTEDLKKELLKLNLQGYEFYAEKKSVNGISGTNVIINPGISTEPRTFRDIVNLIEESGLDKKVRKQSIDIFTNLARAESRIHNIPVEKVHFHEVGAVDSVIDIVGAVAALNLLGVENIVSSDLKVGSGIITCSHGELPVPVPATLELLKNVPFSQTNINTEILTPTGAAIITTLARNFGRIPDMKVKSVGYGFGKRELPKLNMLRVIIGNTMTDSNLHNDYVKIIETNIDDMNPQFYEHIMDLLFQNGAKDVFITSILMKKNRPGNILTVICDPSDESRLTDIIFRETTTLGVRISVKEKRTILKREIITLKTPWGDARAKIRYIDKNRISASPEYEDCKRIAREKNLPIKYIFETVKIAADNFIKNNFS